jgi:hypothetical protein
LRAGGPSKTCGNLAGCKVNKFGGPENRSKRTTVTVIAEEHFFASIVLVADFARELNTKKNGGSKSDID